MRKKNVTLKILSFLILADVLETLTQVCFKNSVIGQLDFSINAPQDVLLILKAATLSPYLWLGLVSVFAILVVWSTILSRIDLSVAVPIASFSYIFIPLASQFFLHERISPIRWAGIIFILIGVIFVSLSSGHKEQATT